MPNSKDFPLPLDTDIIEQVPVIKNNFNPATGKVSRTTELETQIVRYMDVPKEKIRCKPGTHLFPNKVDGRWVIYCTNCGYGKKITPNRFRIEQGALIHIATGIRV